MSMFFVFQYAVLIAPRTPKAAARFVMIRISGKRPSSALSVEPGLNPNQPEPEDQHAEAEQRHVVPRDRPRLPVGGVLPAARPEVQQRREGAGRADQVDRRRAREVLHAGDARAEPVALLQEASAEHPVGPERVDDRREDDGVDDVDAELDPLERRAPDDRQGDAAEHELEEELRLHGGVGEPHHWERRLRIAEVAQEEAVVADELAGAEGEGEAADPPHHGRDREVREDLRDHRARRSSRERSRSRGRRSRPA